jgi:hypothetical protein
LEVELSELADFPICYEVAAKAERIPGHQAGRVEDKGRSLRKSRKRRAIGQIAVVALSRLFNRGWKTD